MLPCVGITVTSSVEVAMLGDGSEGGSMMSCVGAVVASSDVISAMLVVGAKVGGGLRKSEWTKGRGRRATKSGAGLRVTE